MKDIEKKIIEHVIQVMTYSSCMILSKQYLDISEYGKQIDNRLVNVQFFTDKQIGVQKMLKYCKTVCGLINETFVHGLDLQIITPKFCSVGARLINSVISGNLSNKLDIYQAHLNA